MGLSCRFTDEGIAPGGPRMATPPPLLISAEAEALAFITGNSLSQEDVGIADEHKCMEQNAILG